MKSVITTIHSNSHQIVKIGFFSILLLIFTFSVLSNIKENSKEPNLQNLQSIKNREKLDHFEGIKEFQITATPSSSSKVSPPLNGCYYKNYLLPSQKKDFQLPKIFFLKTYKVGSSTLAGILRGLGDKYEKITLTPPNDHILMLGHEDFEKVIKLQNITDGKVDIICNHIREYRSSLIDRFLGPNYFKITIARHPVQRTLSGFYFSRTKPFCSFSVWEWIEKCPSFQNGIYLSTLDKDKQSHGSIEQILKRFDLVMVTERYSESLIVLMWKLGLNIIDLLHISSKKGIRNDTLTSDEYEFFVNQSLKNNQRDLELFEVANELLDAHIAKLQPKNLEQNKMILEKMIQDIEVACPFSNQDCYWRDNGCQRTCLKNWIATNIQCF